MKEFSFRTRANSLQSWDSSQVFDVLVIGGGITGAAVARDAALRGLKVCLIEKNDFASGTSSGSSKLIHGGIRYLENYEFNLVKTAIHEREILKQLYAPLVYDIDFVFPTYKGRTPHRLLLDLGLWLYDSFSRFRVRHKSLSAKRTLELFPLLEPTDLTGSCVYQDSFAEDYRLVIELIKSAAREGASIFSRAELVAAEQKNSLWVSNFRDVYSNQTFTVQSKTILNCSGPYADSVRSLFGLKPALKLTQGIHLIIPHSKLPIDRAYVLSDAKLHRILFAIPWKGITYFGTTDTSIENVDDAKTQISDVDYILEIVNQNFKRKIKSQDLIQSWTGVRPLIKPEGDVSNSAISREHRIDEGPENVFHALGGKLTSHRTMAEEMVDLLKREFKDLKPTKTNRAHLLDGVEQISPSASLSDHVEFSIRNEMALVPLDFLKRRSSLFYEKPDPQTIHDVTRLFANQMSWNENQINNSLKETLSDYQWNQGAFLNENHRRLG